MATCDRAGCSEAGTRQLRFAIRAAGSEAVADASASLFVCQAHATKEAADEIFGHEPGRRKIEDAFRAIGRAAPDWPRCYAYWQPIADRTAH